MVHSLQVVIECAFPSRVWTWAVTENSKIIWKIATQFHRRLPYLSIANVQNGSNRHNGKHSNETWTHISGWEHKVLLLTINSLLPVFIFVSIVHFYGFAVSFIFGASVELWRLRLSSKLKWRLWNVNFLIFASHPTQVRMRKKLVRIYKRIRFLLLIRWWEINIKSNYKTCDIYSNINAVESMANRLTLWYKHPESLLVHIRTHMTQVQWERNRNHFVRAIPEIIGEKKFVYNFISVFCERVTNWHTCGNINGPPLSPWHVSRPP